MTAKDNLVKLTLIFMLVSPSFFITGCDNKDDGPDVVFEFNFRETDGSWEPFFTGYNVGWEETMELEAGYHTLPEPLETEDNAHFISAMNRSDDVKMLFRKQVDGLEPGMNYLVSFTIRFATEVPSGCAGIGGSPGEAVKVIAAADITKPEPVTGLISDDYYVLNWQYMSDNPGEWYQGSIIGDIANSRECEDGYEFELKEVSSRQDHNLVTADENGRIWLLFGTRSGFEGQTNLYYTYFRADFRR